MAVPRCQIQWAISATTETTLIDGTQTAPLLLKSFKVCNRDPAGDRFRVRLRLKSEAVADKQFLWYDYPVNGNDTVEMITTGGEIALESGDLLTIYAGLANLSVTIFAVAVDSL